jgi:hypothetical protein
MKSALCILFVSIPLMAAESVPRGRGHTQRRVAGRGYVEGKQIK